ncbi:DUF6257 family protein [Streptomyces sp. NPDC005409]|uniref:DUF6257 family protein n=1 Tax=Streptomyces sp. NPDC005409 TaxID=3155342 RepID=UPI003451A722
MAKDPKFTAGETAKLTWLVARMAKRGIASETVHLGDLQKKVDRIVDGAREREQQQAIEQAAAEKAARKAAAKAKNRK